MNEIRCLGILGSRSEEIYHQARRKPSNYKTDAYMVYFLGSLTEEGLLGEQGFVLLDTTVKVNPFLPEWSGRLFVFHGEHNTFLAKPAPRIRVVENGFSYERFFELKDCSVVGLVVAVVPSDVNIWPFGAPTNLEA